MDALPLDFEIVPAAPERDDALQLSLESWEGPLDLLLTLARSQKVDLKQISILALVEQYLTFIAEARELKLEVAADYLVMPARRSEERRVGKECVRTCSSRVSLCHYKKKAMMALS